MKTLVITAIVFTSLTVHAFAQSVGVSGLSRTGEASTATCAQPHWEQLYDGSFAFSCVPEPHATLFHALIVGGMALQGADAMQTAYVIGGGRGTELNPVLQPFSAHPATFGAVKLGVAALTSWGVIKLHASSSHRWVAVALLAEEYVVETWCIAHNARVLNDYPIPAARR